jgi:hypothetical protein
MSISTASERAAEYKSEYIGGYVLAMSGASRAHNVIAANMSATLNLQLAAVGARSMPRTCV